MPRLHTAVLIVMVVAASTGLATGQDASTFEYQGEKFSLQRFPKQPDAVERPVVVLVHGIDGLAAPSGSQIRKFAKEIADAGFLAVVPHYFGQGDGSDSDELPKLIQVRLAKFSDYVPRLAAAIEAAAGQSDADESRIGLIGFSLGGGLVLKHAQSTSSDNIKAVVDFFGYIPDSTIYTNADKLPPTVIFHNKKDKVVKLQVSKDLLTALKQAGVQHDHRFYDETNELRRHHTFSPGGPADIDSRMQTLDWLKTHVKR